MARRFFGTTRVRLIGPSFTQENSGTPFELNRSHHLFNSVNLGTPFKTACGRNFDPQMYMEMLQAMVDQSWAQAVGRALKDDAEYVETVRTEGGAAQEIDRLGEGGRGSDDEFMAKLRVVLEKDKKVSLCVCAMQDAYGRVREKRDKHATEVAARGTDPLAALKGKSQFGAGTPAPM